LPLPHAGPAPDIGDGVGRCRLGIPCGGEGPGNGVVECRCPQAPGMEPMGGAKKGGSMMGLVTKDRDRKIKDMNEFNSFGTQNADTSLHEPPPLLPSRSTCLLRKKNVHNRSTTPTGRSKTPNNRTQKKIHVVGCLIFDWVR